MQKRLQVIETEGTANGDRLCRISSPKLTIRIATNGSKDYGRLSAFNVDNDREVLYSLRQSTSCPGLRRRICFESYENYNKRVWERMQTRSRSIGLGCHPAPRFGELRVSCENVRNGHVDEVIPALTDLQHHILHGHVSSSNMPRTEHRFLCACS